MTRVGRCWLVADGPASIRHSAGHPHVVDAIPDEPWDLSDEKLLWSAQATDQSSGAAIVEAVLRGVDVVARIDGLDAQVLALLHDDLIRIGQPPLDVWSRGVLACCATRELTEEQIGLLSLLADGATVTTAARRLGLSSRTAARRLEAARTALGVDTNAEAVRAMHTEGS